LIVSSEIWTECTEIVHPVCDVGRIGFDLVLAIERTALVLLWDASRDNTRWMKIFLNSTPKTGSYERGSTRYQCSSCQTLARNSGLVVEIPQISLGSGYITTYFCSVFDFRSRDITTGPSYLGYRTLRLPQPPHVYSSHQEELYVVHWYQFYNFSGSQVKVSHGQVCTSRNVILKPFLYGK